VVWSDFPQFIPGVFAGISPHSPGFLGGMDDWTDVGPVMGNERGISLSSHVFSFCYFVSLQIIREVIGEKSARHVDFPSFYFIRARRDLKSGEQTNRKELKSGETNRPGEISCPHDRFGSLKKICGMEWETGGNMCNSTKSPLKHPRQGARS
jgi:hypothetical protein